ASSAGRSSHWTSVSASRHGPPSGHSRPNTLTPWRTAPAGGSGANFPLHAPVIGSAVPVAGGALRGRRGGALAADPARSHRAAVVRRAVPGAAVVRLAVDRPTAPVGENAAALRGRGARDGLR